MLDPEERQAVETMLRCFVARIDETPFAVVGPDGDLARVPQLLAEAREMDGSSHFLLAADAPGATLAEVTHRTGLRAALQSIECDQNQLDARLQPGSSPAKAGHPSFLPSHFGQTPINSSSATCGRWPGFSLRWPASLSGNPEPGGAPRPEGTWPGSVPLVGLGLGTTPVALGPTWGRASGR